MHLLPSDTRSLDDEAVAVDLGQSPADLVFLSFSDSDLAALSAAHAAAEGLPSLRLANLARLRHPFSVDLYLDKVAARSRFVLVRLLGGLDYWRYGAEELARLARAQGIGLALVPGCDREDPRLDDLSTLPAPELRRLWAYFREGGPDNALAALRAMAARIGGSGPVPEPRPVPAAGLHPALERPGPDAAPLALIVFYRSALLAADTEPFAALADGLAARGLRVIACHVASLKDGDGAAVLAEVIAARRPDVILNATAFSGRRDTGGSVLDSADCPVLQIVTASTAREAWAASSRGLNAADLAMHVVLPEIDGRIAGGLVSFKMPGAARPGQEFAPVRHVPEPDALERVVARAVAWVRLRRTPRSARRLACVLSDYPGKSGRAGYAVGLDTPASLAALVETLAAAGYDAGPVPDAGRVMADLTRGEPVPVLSLAAYEAAFATLPAAVREPISAAWGPAAPDPTVISGAFAFRVLRLGRLLVAVQPDRGRAADRRSDYHDPALPPAHGYVAFHLWLRQVEAVDALIQLGTHGTLEWLPGKAVAPGPACAPEALIGDVPVVYPFIVNNPGEASQAKRRIGAVTIGHLTPPLVEAGLEGALADMEALFDEYADADGLDPRRARLLAGAILDRARETGLAQDCGLPADVAGPEALQRLDAWLCDIKEARIGDGLHVFGQGMGEAAGLLAALDGRFVPPGPSGSPAAGRLDVLPTGRNLFAVDPRAIPTRTAAEIGRRAAEDLLARHAQDHGEWPRRVVLDLWGSATMRTGGEDLAQALALLGVAPTWDMGSTRVSGFEILPLARLGRPRVDVTLRISGLFRDVFPEQIALFDAAVRAVAALDEAEVDNPLAAARASDGGQMARIFGAAPSAYGLDVAKALAADRLLSREELGARYLAGTAYAYGGADATPRAAGDGFRQRVAGADAFLHNRDLPEVDALNSDVEAGHVGGFAAAAALLGARPALYQGDAARPGRYALRPLGEDLARAVRSRAANPRWIRGQMRHGWRGAMEIAETLDSLFAYAVTAEAVASHHFDLVFDATLGDDAVRAFLVAANPDAARSMAETFEAARARGLWISRRNSTAEALALARGAA